MAGRKKKDAGAQDETAGLFELPPERFTAARDELAKKASAEDRSEDARTIKALRRPTVAAWAVNQLSRAHLEELEELLESGAELRRAQRKVLSGVKSGDFREASEQRRRLITRLLRRAEDILHESGHASPGATEAVRSTLEAASLDDDAADLVRSGKLSKELPPPASFGAVEGLGLVPAPAEERVAPKPRAKRGPEREREEARALKQEREAAAREHRSLVERAAQSRRTAIRAREEADRTEARAERLREQAEEARARARESARKAQQSEAEASKAQEAADRAQRRAEQLESKA